MKALRVHDYGSLDGLVVDDVPRPSAGDGEVLVRIETASLNQLDLKLVSGALKDWFPLQLPAVSGTDFAGTVVAAGPGATQWKPGQRVLGRFEPSMPAGARGGAFAEYAVVPQQWIASVRQDADLVEAAALPTCAVTAWMALFDEARLTRGQRVLIHAGAGGVGSFAIQLAKRAGAYVITTASATKAAYVRELGADEVIDYRAHDFTTQVRDVDVVIDTIGGDVGTASLDVLKPGGILVGVAQPPDVQAATAKNVRSAFVFCKSDAAVLGLVVGLWQSGELVVRTERHAFGDALAQLRNLADGHATGKIVLELGAA